MNFRRHRLEEPDLMIDLAPLIDVVFILLIFFMVTTTFDRESALEVNLPESSQEKPLAEQPQLIEISIDASGHYAVDGKRLANSQPATLKRALSGVAEQRDNPSLLLVADGKAPHQAVISAMDAASQLGLTRLRFATRATGERD